MKVLASFAVVFGLMSSNVFAANSNMFSKGVQKALEQAIAKKKAKAKTAKKVVVCDDLSGSWKGMCYGEAGESYEMETKIEMYEGCYITIGGIPRSPGGLINLGDTFLTEGDMVASTNFQIVTDWSQDGKVLNDKMNGVAKLIGNEGYIGLSFNAQYFLQDKQLHFVEKGSIKIEGQEWPTQSRCVLDKVQ